MKIQSIDVRSFPKDRSYFLSMANIVISEPSSSLYNYLAFCSADTICILLLPGAFASGCITKRDALDWSGIIKHVWKGRIIPFYGDLVEEKASELYSRIIDHPCNYNMDKLDAKLRSYL